MIREVILHMSQQGDSLSDMKTCNKCKETKPLDDFSNKKSTKDGKNTWCRACMSASSKSWYEASPETRERRRESRRNWDRKNTLYKRDYRARIRYGVSMAVARMLYDAPCDLCGERKDKMNIDHCHKTGRVRGALCNRCNVAIHILDDPERMARAVEYVNSDKDYRDV